MTTLTQPMIIWCFVAGICATLIIEGLIGALICLARCHWHHIVTIGSEKEEFFIPGDRLASDAPDYDDYDEIGRASCRERV